jgi:hypothetical protein
MEREVDDRPPMPTPVPVDGCVQCERLVYAEATARSSSDHSAEVDARVRLRWHLDAGHP